VSTRVHPGEIVIPGARAQPKFATRRQPGAKTDGARIAKIACSIGKPGMPWQKYVWDVSRERDAFGRLKYRYVFVTVPRQSGKTTLFGPVQINECVTKPNVRTFYTAQTGKDARSRFKDLAKLVSSSPLEALATFRWSAGDEGILWPNGSETKLFAPTLTAIHGETPPLVGLDEIFALDEALGDGIVDDAVLPAQQTLEGQAQIWFMSTAGTAKSTFMKKWVERGRAGFPGLCYIEFSLPDGANPYDPEVIADFHPAVGYTTTVAGLLSIAHGGVDDDGNEIPGLSLAKWLRAYCNTWTEAVDPIMDPEVWDALKAPPGQYVPLRSEIAITYELAPDDETASIMAAWRDPDTDRPQLRVLHTAPGTTWVLALLVKLYKEWRPRVLGADDGGPTRRITKALRKILDAEGTSLEDSAVKTLGPRDYNTACDSLLNLAETNGLNHDGSKTLSNGIAHLVVKEANGVKSFSRDMSTGPVAGLIAGAVGVWLYDNHKTPLGKPEIYS
jgi:hypothetical protein